MNTRKRIELIIEKMAYKRACRIFESVDVSGYTVLPALAGYGNGNRWQRDQDISGSRDMVMVVSILDEATAEKALEQISNLLGEHVGVVTISDVTVLRPERF